MSVVEIAVRLFITSAVTASVVGVMAEAMYRHPRARAALLLVVLAATIIGLGCIYVLVWALVL